jgi:hypothetical protein
MNVDAKSLLEYVETLSGDDPFQMNILLDHIRENLDNSKIIINGVHFFVNPDLSNSLNVDTPIHVRYMKGLWNNIKLYMLLKDLDIPTRVFLWIVFLPSKYVDYGEPNFIGEIKAFLGEIIFRDDDDTRYWRSNPRMGDIGIPYGNFIIPRDVYMQEYEYEFNRKSLYNLLYRYIIRGDIQIGEGPGKSLIIYDSVPTRRVPPVYILYTNNQYQLKTNNIDDRINPSVIINKLGLLMSQ